MDEELKPPEHLTVHFKKNGVWHEKKYLRFHHPNQRVKDYALPHGEKLCEGNGVACPKEPASAPTEGG